MYFLVNASPPKPLNVAISNFADALVRSKAGICDGGIKFLKEFLKKKSADYMKSWKIIQ